MYIERLELDLGTLPLRQLEPELLRAVAVALEKSLQKQISLKASSPAPACEYMRAQCSEGIIDCALIHFLHTGTLPWTFHLKQSRSFEEEILLSWQERRKSGADPLGAKDDLLRVLDSAGARRRLVLQFSSRFLGALLSLFSAAGKETFDEVAGLLRKAVSPMTSRRVERHLWERAFALVAARNAVTVSALVTEARDVLIADEQDQPGVEGFLRSNWPQAANPDHPTPLKENGGYNDEGAIGEVLRLLQNRNVPGEVLAMLESSLRQTARAKGGGSTLAPEDLVGGTNRGCNNEGALDEVLRLLQNRNVPGEILAMLESHLRRTSRAKDGGRTLAPEDLAREIYGALAPSAPGRSELKGLQERHLSTDARETKSETPLRPESSLPGNLAGSDNPAELLREGIYIGNAGLVLVHPFLPQFFAALGVAVEDKLTHPERALCLLHFLSTEQATAPEYELLLPKVLCNIPLETPAEADVGLTQHEMNEACALLEAAIRHWGALGNSSPDALRGTFLLRQGKLSQREGDWLLQVESKTCDILLEQLPWGISMIKLPWMKKMLWVEWN